MRGAVVPEDRHRLARADLEDRAADEAAVPELDGVEGGRIGGWLGGADRAGEEKSGAGEGGDPG